MTHFLPSFFVPALLILDKFTGITNVFLMCRHVVSYLFDLFLTIDVHSFQIGVLFDGFLCTFSVLCVCLIQSYLC